MTTSENIQLLLDGGYTQQANRMADSASVSVEYDTNPNNATVYFFNDGSQIAISASIP